MVTAVANLQLHEKIAARREEFQKKFSHAAQKFIRSHFNDFGAAIAAIRSTDIKCKNSTEKVLANQLAWWALLHKSDAGMIESDAKDILESTWKEFYKRECGLWRHLYH